MTTARNPWTVFRRLFLTVAVGALATVVVVSQQPAAELEDATSSYSFSSAKRGMVEKLVQATLQAANAQSLEELFTADELHAILDSVGGGGGGGEAEEHSFVKRPLGMRHHHDRSATAESPVCEQPEAEAAASITASTTSTSTNNHNYNNYNNNDESLDDRRARLVAEAPYQYDCMEREFDALDPNFDPHEAARVYYHCRMLVVKNVYNATQMELYAKLSQDFVDGLHEGRVSQQAEITNEKGSAGYFNERSPGKWEILHPDYFLTYAKDFAMSKVLLEIVMDPYILGDDAIFGGSGVLLAEAGTDAGHWHTDDTFLFGTESHNEIGVAGHDIPAFAINMATPLVNVTADSGLTEYCVGTSHLAGVGSLRPSQKWLDNDDFMELYLGSKQQHCPPGNWRMPVVKPGDVVLWDYLIKHRSGSNRTPKNRPFLFSTYGRRWYSDDNFTPSGMGYAQSDEDFFLAPRFMAVLDDPYPEACAAEIGREAAAAANLLLCDITPADSVTDGLMDIGRLFHPHVREYHATPPFTPKIRTEFVVANKDIENAVFHVNNDLTFPLDEKDYVDVEAPIGSKMRLTVGDSDDAPALAEWTIRPKHSQIFVSRQSVGLF